MNPTTIYMLIGLVAMLATSVLKAGESFNPSAGHINQALTNLVVKHPTMTGFIADEIANVIPVAHESDFFWKVLNAGVLDQSLRTLKAAGGESNKIEIQWTQDSYACAEHALHDDLPHRTRDNADDQLGLETEHVAAVREAVLLAKEIRSAATLFSTSSMTNNGGVTYAWDGATTSSVKLWTDLLNAQYYVQKFGGAEANDIAMGLKTWKAVATYLMTQAGTAGGVRWMGVAELLKENPLARPKGLGPLTLHVGGATYSTAKKPEDVSRAASGGNMTEVWNGSALVYHRGAPGIKSIQLAARFMKTGWPRVRQGTYADTRASDWYEYAENESGVKVIAPSCGYLLTSANT